MTIRTLALRYAFFALLATTANLATQRLVLSGGESSAVFAAAVGAGTIVGLVLKYFLDKRWIFADRSTGMRAHGQKLSLYTAMGIVTTAIFWCTETAFWLLWQSDIMREVGAIIGLTFGYVLKYQLDRRFVFTGTNLAQAS